MTYKNFPSGNETGNKIFALAASHDVLGEEQMKRTGEAIDEILRSLKEKNFTYSEAEYILETCRLLLGGLAHLGD